MSTLSSLAPARLPEPETRQPDIAPRWTEDLRQALPHQRAPSTLRARDDLDIVETRRAPPTRGPVRYSLDAPAEHSSSLRFGGGMRGETAARELSLSTLNGNVLHVQRGGGAKDNVPYQEDRAFDTSEHISGLGRVHITGICDGHGGEDAAHFVSQQLPVILLRLLRNATPRNPDELVAHVQKAIDRVEQALEKLSIMSGCTLAMSVRIPKWNASLLVNLGDSKVLRFTTAGEICEGPVRGVDLASPGAAVCGAADALKLQIGTYMTTDHVASNAAELSIFQRYNPTARAKATPDGITRIEQNGLEATRSLGDILKRPLPLRAAEYMLVPHTPSTHTLLCSDGFENGESLSPARMVRCITDPRAYVLSGALVHQELRVIDYIKKYPQIRAVELLSQARSLIATDAKGAAEALAAAVAECETCIVQFKGPAIALPDFVAQAQLCTGSTDSSELLRRACSWVELRWLEAMGAWCMGADKTWKEAQATGIATLRDLIGRDAFPTFAQAPGECLRVAAAVAMANISSDNLSAWITP